jgi:hypothetical protein
MYGITQTQSVRIIPIASIPTGIDYANMKHAEIHKA